MSDRGVSIVAAILIMLTLALFGASLVTVVSEEQAIYTNEVEQARAFYISMAGLEYGLKEITEGSYPNATNKAFGGGTFTTQVIPDAHVMTVASAAGDARRNYQINVPQLAGDCAALDSTGAVPIGSHKDEINRVKIRKSCMNRVRIDRFYTSWEPDTGQKFTRLDYDGETIYNYPTGVVSGTTVDVADTVISDNSEHQFSRIIYTSEISDTTMTMRVYYTDGSHSDTTWLVKGTGNDNNDDDDDDKKDK